MPMFQHLEFFIRHLGFYFDHSWTSFFHFANPSRFLGKVGVFYFGDVALKYRRCCYLVPNISTENFFNCDISQDLFQ